MFSRNQQRSVAGEACEFKQQIARSLLNALAIADTGWVGSRSPVGNCAENTRILSGITSLTLVDGPHSTAYPFKTMQVEARKFPHFVPIALLIVAWLSIHRLALQWLGNSFQQLSVLNQILLAVVGLAAIARGIRLGWPGFSPTPSWRPFPLLIIFGSAIASIFLHWLLNIEQFSVLFLILGSYGVLGLFLDPKRWTKGLAIAALVACILPFAPPLGRGGFGGLPTRLLTAHLVEHFLTSTRIAAVSSHDIVVLENGIAWIDLPCSGIKSLWMGSLLLLAATGLERRKLGWRWLGVAIANLLLLFSANAARVLLLVLIAEVGQQPDLAAIAHLPLGLLGFILACGASWGLLQTVSKSQPQVSRPAIAAKLLPQHVQPFLLASVLVLAIAAQLVPARVAPQIAQIHWPEQFATESIPLTPAEQRFFNTEPGTIPEKRRFTRGNLSGSILAVANTSWRTYHPPELCIASNGLKVDGMEQVQLAPDISGRWLSLKDGQLSATYWLQSPQQTTDDFFASLGRNIFARQQPWVLVSILFDRAWVPDDPQLQDFTRDLHGAIAQSFSTTETQRHREGEG